MTTSRTTRIFQLYVVPGAVFQSVMVGGGYGTGREIVEYFTAYGAFGGLVGILVAFLALAVVLALTFELARVFKAYEYRALFKHLLGRAWFLFEVLIILQFLLVLAVLASAAGNILRDNLGLPYGVGLAVMLLLVGVLTFFGRDLIAKVLTFWSFFLYAVFVVFLFGVMSTHWAEIHSHFSKIQFAVGATQSGFKYALYNLAAAPLLLYVARVFDTRIEAMTSGVFAAVIAMLPALMFHVGFMALYPVVLDQAIPVYWAMSELGMSLLVVVYSVMLFGTFIETGAGMLQGINERIDAYLIERRGSGLSRFSHAALAVASVAVSAALSLVGITKLIAAGYGTMAWGFFAVYVAPLLTIGAYRILTSREARSDSSI